MLEALNTKINEWAVARIKREGLIIEEEIPVAFSSQLPPEYIITKHAEERLKERFTCRQDKLMKVTMKAWRSALPVQWWMIRAKKRLGYTNTVLKHFNGYIWVFAPLYNKSLGFSQKVLITLYNPKLVKKDGDSTMLR